MEFDIAPLPFSPPPPAGEESPVGNTSQFPLASLICFAAFWKALLLERISRTRAFLCHFAFRTAEQ